MKPVQDRPPIKWRSSSPGQRPQYWLRTFSKRKPFFRKTGSSQTRMRFRRTEPHFRRSRTGSESYEMFHLLEYKPITTARYQKWQENRRLRFSYSCDPRHRTVATCKRCKDSHARHQISLVKPNPRPPPRQVSAIDCGQQDRELFPEVRGPRRSAGEPISSPGVSHTP